MAKFTVPALLAAMGSFFLQASAQEFNTSDPFILLLSSDDATVSGQTLGACHSGAAIEQLCLAGNDTTPSTYNTFTFNVSTSASVPEDQEPTGILVWELHGGNFNVSSGLTFNGLMTLDSNVVAPQIQPGGGSVPASVAFDEDDKLFLYSSYVDDSTFVPGEFPVPATQRPLYHVSCIANPMGRRHVLPLPPWGLDVIHSLDLMLTFVFESPSGTLVGQTASATTTTLWHGSQLAHL